MLSEYRICRLYISWKWSYTEFSNWIDQIEIYENAPQQCFPDIILQKHELSYVFYIVFEGPNCPIKFLFFWLKVA